MINNMAAFISGLVIAFVASWRMTLVGVALSPLIVITGKIQAGFVAGMSEKTDDAYKDS